jgi:CHAD domain-containing protein
MMSAKDRSMNPTVFQIEHGALAQLIDKLQQNFAVTDQQHEKLAIDYLDTFDWSLFKHDQTLTRVSSDNQTELLLSKHSDNSVVSKLPNPGSFTFARDLPEHPIKKYIHGASKRALIVQLGLKCDSRQWSILNNNGKTIARLSFLSCRITNGKAGSKFAIVERLFLIPVKGYEKKAEKIKSVLMQVGSIHIVSQSILESALAEQGRSTSEYTSKVILDLQADMDADRVLQSILSRLLQVMEVNEDGIIKDIDCEFLHDFRIAVRRTRSIIGSIKNVFKPESLKRFKADFAWLGDVTGPARDLDVHLLDFEHYRNMLPDNMCNDITPLRELMINERRIAYDALKKALRSQRYRKLKNDWRVFLQQSSPQLESGNAQNSILQVANTSIWRAYKHTLKKGTHLNAKAPSVAFHDERKECKKLRYLLEFFRKLYPKKELRKLIKALEDIQDQLGKFQDLEVQEHVFHRFADQLMARDDVQSGTLLAMGVLIERIIQQRKAVMAEFSEHFEAFSSANNRKLFKRLFKPEKGASST